MSLPTHRLPWSRHLRRGHAAVIDTVRFRFSGDLDPAAFVAFAEHRARRLDIGLRVRASGRDAATFDVTGAPELVDMFEMACSLGPAECVVSDVTREAISTAM
jgi:hypothetical protein